MSWPKHCSVLFLLLVLSDSLAWGDLQGTCKIQYTNPNASQTPSPTGESRRCAVGVTFANNSGGSGSIQTERVYSCVVSAGEFSCTFSIPAEDIPFEMSLKNAFSTPVITSYELKRGCTYSGQSPSATLDSPESFTLTHRYLCSHL
jgi:hypothetical protein